jgi:hypothetical protein
LSKDKAKKPEVNTKYKVTTNFLNAGALLATRIFGKMLFQELPESNIRDIEKFH